jgi:hypothetical protein
MALKLHSHFESWVLSESWIFQLFLSTFFHIFAHFQMWALMDNIYSFFKRNEPYAYDGKPCSNQMIFNLLKSFWKSLEHSVPFPRQVFQECYIPFEELRHNLVALARYNTISTPLLITTSIALNLLIVRLIIIVKAFDNWSIAHFL